MCGLEFYDAVMFFISGGKKHSRNVQVKIAEADIQLKEIITRVTGRAYCDQNKRPVYCSTA